MHIEITDYQEFKQNVLTGLPKLVTGEAFTTNEERDQTFEFVKRHGLVTVNLGSLIEKNYHEEEEDTDGTYDLDAELKNSILFAIEEGVTNIFSGVYGIV